MRDYDGKTAAERIAERRTRLIDAGRSLFGEHGYAGTSIRAVLRKASMGDPYFAESFADLDALLAAVHDQVIEEVLAVGRSGIEKAATPPEAARAMIDDISKSFAADPGAARIALREVLSGGPVTAWHRQQGHRKLARLLADLIPVTPNVDDEHRLLVGRGLIAAGDALLLGWLSGEAGLTRTRVVEISSEMFAAVVAHHLALGDADRIS